MSDLRHQQVYCTLRAPLAVLAAALVLTTLGSQAWAQGDQADSSTGQASTQPTGTTQAATQAATAPTSTPVVAKGGVKIKLLHDPDGSKGFLGESGSGMLWRMLAYVLVILVLGAIATVVMKRVMPRIAATSGKEMALIETLHLGSRKTVHMVRVGSRRFLVTASGDRVSGPTEVTSAFDDILNSRMPPGDQDDRALDGQEGDVL